MTIGFFDLETQKLFAEVGGRYPEEIQTPKLGLAVAGLVIDNQPIRFYEENNVRDLIEELKKVDIIVGHNLIRFDYLVLKPYTKFNLQELKTIDMMLILDAKIRRFISLDHLAELNLGMKKTIDSIKIPGMWRNGERDAVKAYLSNDVEMSKRLYFHGKNKPIKLVHPESKKTLEIKVDW